MRFKATYRWRKTGGARRAMVLFVTLWLNVAIQPCAMAFADAEDHDCPHCPPGTELAMPSHHVHGGEEQQAPCATLESACVVEDDVNYDARSGDLKLKDVQTQMPVLVGFEIFDVCCSDVLETGRVTEPIYRRGTSPPLNVLYCVYLD